MQGTTGYEFANDVTRLFVDPDAEEPFTALYRRLTGESRGFEEIARGEARAGNDGIRARTAASGEEHSGPNLAASLASFHVYRTYIEPYAGLVADEDRFEIARANISETLARTLLLEQPGAEEFVTRLQQTTGAVMAKGVEDTAFYRYVRLAALNEVGGNPGRFAGSGDDFHRQTSSARCGSRCSSWRRPRTTRSAQATCAPASSR